MSNRDKLVEILESLRKTEHDECEDCWYSCPARPEEYCGQDDSKECNCGMEYINNKIDQAIQLLNTL